MLDNRQKGALIGQTKFGRLEEHLQARSGNRSGKGSGSGSGSGNENGKWKWKWK